jgi:Ca2+-binding RTX toxin-like protein
VFTYAIDWNNDNVVDQTVSGPSGMTVDHAYATGGSYYARVTATANVGGQDYSSYSAFQYVTVFAVSTTIQTDPGNGALKALVVEGTASAETLVLSPAAGNAVGLSINGTSVGTLAAPGGMAFGHLLVYGYGGNDTLRLSGGVTVPAFLFGGDGNDILDAGGSTANNALVGGAGADALTGGSRGDLLIGSLGADTLRGGAGDDILIGGYTDYDANLTALCAIMKEWSRTDANYTTRVNHLNGSLSGGLNGSYRLTAKTVKTVNDDASVDSLFGEAGLDWFFARTSGKTKDKVNDKSSGEVVTAIS